jgi:putative nucleotidyltransferase with HDIG domain
MDATSELYREIMAKAEQLPPMPQTITAVMEMSRTDDYTAVQLADVVCQDPTLATRVLKLCNSGFFGLTQEVTSIQRAVLLLGFEMVKNLVFSSFVHSVMRGDVIGYAQTAQSLWEHSLGTATASLAVAQRIEPELAETAYTAGLIHDIGKVLLASFMAEKFEKVLDHMRERRVSCNDAERAILGTTHQEIGGLVADRWRIAPELKDAIVNHHSPEFAEHAPRLAAIINLGDSFCGMMGVGSGIEATDGIVKPSVLKLLHIDDAMLEEISAEILQRVFALQHSDAFGAL